MLRNMAIINNNLALLEEFFTKYSDLFVWHRPSAGITAFPRLKHSVPIDELAKQLISEQGVMILPGTVYDDPNNHFRIGFGRANMPEALERFELFIRSNFTR